MTAPSPQRGPPLTLAETLQDRALWWLVLLGLYLRLYTLARWPTLLCLRDECTYLALSQRILDGEGMTPAAAGWLWAPGYPALLAVHEAVFGAAGGLRVTQALLSPLMIVLAAALARAWAETEEQGRRAARWAAALIALSPTLIFFSVRLWSESLYLTVLLGALWALTRARAVVDGRGLAPALVAGLLLGIAVLSRGVAQYLLPLFVLGLLWGRARAGAPQVVALVVAAALTVAPYSAWATARWGSFTLSDRTLGQMMWLGDNSFPPVTFDHGVGLTDPAEFDRVTATGRPHCEFTGDPAAWDACETARGKEWILNNPGEFLARVPLRLAQLLNPNSFLTRHLAMGRWASLPREGAFGLAGLTVVWSLTAVLGGAVALIVRGRGWAAALTALILGYHCAAIAITAGLSRYRVPLDCLLLLWLALALGDLKGTREAWARSPARGAAALLVALVLLGLALRSLVPGFL
ncbi:hypothetical protein L6R49_24855 [Myxococcota bacterium]|nr:hypothetical protein [Myxococcota bacterium]